MVSLAQPQGHCCVQTSKYVSRSCVWCLLEASQTLEDVRSSSTFDCSNEDLKTETTLRFDSTTTGFGVQQNTPVTMTKECSFYEVLFEGFLKKVFSRLIELSCK